MNAIEIIKEKLKKYPQLIYSIEDNYIKIEPPDDTGFSVWMSDHNPGYTIGYDGWHEEIEHLDEALEAFVFGLSTQCRLKVIQRGNIDCAWTLEYKVDNNWIEDSSTNLFFVPFWKKKNIIYKQNNIIS